MTAPLPRRAFAFAGTALLLTGLGAACGREGDPVPPPPGAVTLATPAEIAGGAVAAHSYIVTFRGQVGAARQFGSFAAEARLNYAALSRPVTADPRVKDLRYITTVDLANPKDPERVRALDPPRALRLAWNAAGTAEIPGAIAQVEFASEADAAAALHDWEAQKLLWFAEPNHQSRPSQEALTPELIRTYTDMAVWWHASIRLVEALNLIASKGITPTKPVIAVLDSGVDAENQYLSKHIWHNPKVGVADCGTDVYGCNATDATKDTFGNGDVYPYTTKNHGEACPNADSPIKALHAQADSCGHGTHVAGIIAATADGTGSAAIGGVCPFCQIMIIKVIKDGVAADSSILNGFKYLTRFKQASGDDLVHVANASIGTFSRSRAIALLITVLSRPPNNVLVVAAAGNEDAIIRSYPAGFPEALAVAATGQDDVKAIYSNYGPWVGISAPGGDASHGPQIMSTIPGLQGKGEKQGTSMASPVVAGVAGLVLAADPGRSTSALRASLLRTADPRLYAPGVGYNLESYYPAYPDEGRIPLLGSGIVDAAAAIANERVSGVALEVDDTVSRGCGTLPGRENRPWRGLVAALVLAAPLLGLFRERRVRVPVHDA